MANRTRPIRKEICLSESEEQLIAQKMAQLGTKNFGAYARKMLIDGYIINVDYTELKKLIAAVSKIGANINQVVHRIKCTERIYPEDIADLRDGVDRVWSALKQRINEEEVKNI